MKIPILASRLRPNSKRHSADEEDDAACPFNSGCDESDCLRALLCGGIESAEDNDDFESLAGLLYHFGQAGLALNRLLRAGDWLSAQADEGDAALLEALQQSRRRAMEKGRMAVP